ncbi:MAG: anion transporter [Nanoarchaeota archaeon]|nr:anion transporter [Nanoarchaeota archaeon]
MIIPLLVLAVVFLLIAIRQIGRFRLEIWQIMLFGAIAVLIMGQISLLDAVKSVNPEVMLFLFGMFIIGQALEASGYLSHLSYKLFKKAKSAEHLLLFILFGGGIASAFLMNDTIAIIGTPIVLLLARKHCLPAKPLLLTLAFAITIGSVMSPIGNPQNLLIALNSGGNPFVTFLKYLFIPTIINLCLAYFLLRFFYKDAFHCSLNHSQEPIKDHRLAFISKVSLLLLVVLILFKIMIVLLKLPFDFSLTYISLISAFPIMLFSSKRVEILKKIDWHTLIFFAAMFVVMQSVWEAGFFQLLLNKLNIEITSISMILLVSILLSQLISNVPLVALYLPLLLHAGAATTEMAALAAGSTIAGNLFILGAASNVIIIQNAEKSGETLTFLEFAKVGIPLTLVNALVYWYFLQ